LIKAGAELVIGKNTVIKKAISIKIKDLKSDMEDFEYFSRFGAPVP